MNKIFGLGLSRTGTTTLSQVLNSIGFKIIHYPMNMSVLFSEKNDGATDIPVIPFYKEIDKKFNCKFIYTIRDKEDWLNSMDKYLARKVNWWHKKSDFLIMRETVYGAKHFDRKIYGDAFSRHDEDVKTYFENRKNDFLILDIIGNESPQKLADFLNLDRNKLPNKFPVTNKVKCE